MREHFRYRPVPLAWCRAIEIETVDRREKARAPLEHGWIDDRYRDDRYRGDDDPRRDPRNQPYRKKKKESWLGDILDFG